MAAEVDWRLVDHGRAHHGFSTVTVDGMGDPRSAYDPQADGQSWGELDWRPRRQLRLRRSIAPRSAIA